MQNKIKTKRPVAAFIPTEVTQMAEILEPIFDLYIHIESAYNFIPLNINEKEKTENMVKSLKHIGQKIGQFDLDTIKLRATNSNQYEIFSVISFKQFQMKRFCFIPATNQYIFEDTFRNYMIVRPEQIVYFVPYDIILLNFIRILLRQFMKIMKNERNVGLIPPRLLNLYQNCLILDQFYTLRDEYQKSMRNRKKNVPYHQILDQYSGLFSQMLNITIKKMREEFENYPFLVTVKMGENIYSGIILTLSFSSSLDKDDRMYHIYVKELDKIIICSKYSIDGDCITIITHTLKEITLPSIHPTIPIEEYSDILTDIYTDELFTALLDYYSFISGTTPPQ